MNLPLLLCLYESFWNGFESDQRRLTLLVNYQMRLLVWRVVNKTLKLRLTFLILLTINFPLTARDREKWSTKVDQFFRNFSGWNEPIH